MPRTMADSVTSADIPPGFPMVAGYTDGAYAWSAADWRRHQDSRLVRICAVSLDMSAHVADIENGALTPAQGAEWLKQKVARGEWGVLYFSRSLFGVVHAAVLAAGVKDDQWGQWVADWTGSPPAALSSLAVQYANPATSGGHYDLSLVADHWPGVDLAAPPGPGSARDVLAAFIRSLYPDFWARADIAAAWAAGRQDDVFGEWLKEDRPDFWTRPDIATAWAQGRHDDVIGEWAKERPVAPAGPPPPPITPPPADAQAALATYWAWMAQVLGHDLPLWLQYLSEQVNRLRDV